jgi:hypothetical protein
MTIKLIRIYELTASCSFKESNLSLLVTLDMLLFNKELNLRFSFSLNFKNILKGFAEAAADLFSSIMQLFGDTVKCIARMVGRVCSFSIRLY